MVDVTIASNKIFIEIKFMMLNEFIVGGKLVLGPGLFP